MCNDCYGVPYEKIVADKNHPMRFSLLYSTRTPDLQNVKPLTQTAAKELLASFDAAFPELKKWQERHQEKFLQVDIAAVEKRFLASLESADQPISAGDLLAWTWHYRNSQGGRFSGSHPNQANEPKHASGVSGQDEPDFCGRLTEDNGITWENPDKPAPTTQEPNSSHSSPINDSPAPPKV